MIKTLWQIYGILRWHKRTFPFITAEQQEQKLAEEIREYNEAIERFVTTGRQNDLVHVKEELADITIAIINLMRYPDIRSNIAQKMAINRKRTWKDGHHKD